ncbi:hypothetical protein JOM56_004430 [Amanita muscaria]
MQHVPAEIINEIFKHLIIDILVALNPREFPWYVGQICASWRAEFTSTAWIWRKFTIADARPITEHGLEKAARLVKLCIQRSRNEPISFTFLFCGKYLRPKERQYVNQMLSDLIIESQRWEVVDVEAELLSLKTFCLPNLSNHFPLLRSMALRIHGIHWDEPKCWESFLCAHSLTRVELDELPRYDFDWSRLTVLTLQHETGVPDILRVMRRLRCIERLKYSSLGTAEDGMIALPTLKVLSCPGDVLRHLRAPALEELRIVSFLMDIRPSLLPDGAISFLRTSSGSLTKLILGQGCCIDSDAKRILQELPNVTKLCLDADLDLSDILPYNLEKRLQILPKLELLIADGYSYRSRIGWRQRDAVLTLWATVASRTSNPDLFEWPYRAGKLRELRMIRQIGYDEYHDTTTLSHLCEERKVKYMAFEQSQKAGHIWCSEAENCAFDLCNHNSAFYLQTESLV